MQTHNGIGSCNEDGAMEDPCPDTEIKQMIHDGCRHRSRRRAEASVSFPNPPKQPPHPLSFSMNTDFSSKNQTQQSNRHRRSTILPRLKNVQRRLRRPLRGSRQGLLHEVLRVRHCEPPDGLGQSEPQLPPRRADWLVSHGACRRLCWREAGLVVARCGNLAGNRSCSSGTSRPVNAVGWRRWHVARQ